MTASFESLEAIYEQLAAAIDRAGPDRSAVYLAKVILLLASRTENPALIREAIEQALADL